MHFVYLHIQSLNAGFGFPLLWYYMEIHVSDDNNLRDEWYLERRLEVCHIDAVASDTLALQFDPFHHECILPLDVFVLTGSRSDRRVLLGLVRHL
jgi:hypothetical protein